MKFAHLLALTVVLATGIAFSLFAAGDDEKIIYIEIKTPLAKIYVRHDDPKGLNSDIIRLARKNEQLELLSKGESWYKVRVDGKDGFLQAKDGRVVDKGSKVVTLLLYIVILLACGGGVVLYLKKSQVLTR